MEYNLKIFILIGEILIEGTTTNSLAVSGLDGFGSIHTFDDIADYLNLNGFLSKQGKKWTGTNVKVFCHRMVKKHPEVWEEHLQYEHIGYDRWGLTVGSLSPQQSYKPRSVKVPSKKTPICAANPDWVVMDQKLEQSDYWFHKFQQSLPEKERLARPNDLI
jgi:hypothetical protein